MRKRSGKQVKEAMVAPKGGRRRARPGAPARTDWARLRAMTDEEIDRRIQADPDVAPEIDESWMKDAEVVVPRPTKQGVFIRLDPDVLEYFRRGGPGYQTRLNAVLKAYVRARSAEPRSRRRAGSTGGC